MPDIVIADQLSKQFVLHHARATTVKERVLRLLQGSGRDSADDIFHALSRVSFTIQEGDSVALVGRNGSGKSTLLKLIAGIHHATAGRLLVRSGIRIATMIELGVGFHPELTGAENVYLNAAIHGLTREEIDAVYPDVVEYAELSRFMDSPIKTYSSGMVMRLGFAIGVNLDPDVFLLDEIFAVGDEAFQRKCLKSMLALRERGKTMFFVSHAAQAVREMCTRALVLENGRLHFDGGTVAALERYRRLIGEDDDREAVVQPPPQEPAVDPGWHLVFVGGRFEEVGAHHLAFLREQGLRAEHRVLDLGCGPLRTGIPLMRFLTRGQYVGVERDAKLLAAGIEIEAPKAGVDLSRSRLVAGDVNDLSEVDGVFDVIWAVGLVDYLSNEQMARTLAAGITRLAPDGRFYVGYFEAPSPVTLDPIERPGPSFSYFDRPPRHIDFGTLQRYAEACGAVAERIGEWGDPHGQTMMVVRR